MLFWLYNIVVSCSLRYLVLCKFVLIVVYNNRFVEVSSFFPKEPKLLSSFYLSDLLHHQSHYDTTRRSILFKTHGSVSARSDCHFCKIYMDGRLDEISNL